MTYLVFYGSFFLVSVLSFIAGGLVISEIYDRKHKRELQRSTRPAHITVQRKVRVQHYTVQPGALDISFPNTEECI